MKKSALKALFINAKGFGAKYIGVLIETEGQPSPEVIINPRENFSGKFEYYMSAYDDDLALISAKGKKEIRITAAAEGKSFDDIQSQLFTVSGAGWKKLISDAIEKAYNRMISETPPETEEERIHCEGVKEGIKGMFINDSRTAAEARFIETHIDKYEEIFDICMNGDDLQFKKALVEIQKMQNDFILSEEAKKGDE